MSAPARRGRPGHSLDSLLDVAVAAFNERGFEATSMEELAARLGVTKSAIYHHVPSKVELLRLALDRALDGLFAVTEEPGATTGPAIDRLEHVVRGSVRVLVEELPFVTLLLRVRGFYDVYDVATQLGVLPSHGTMGEKALLMLRGFGLRAGRS